MSKYNLEYREKREAEIIFSSEVTPENKNENRR
jgi:hypothetical protein